tara:strand:- start:137 stop:511 length:375 start_codon:yes stop_codon:yes gene_type:complete
MGMIKKNELNKPTLMGVPVPDIIRPSKISKETGLGTKDLGAAAFGLGVIAAGVKAIKDSKKKKSNVPLPKSKPKFSNIQVPVGKPPQTRKPQTLKGGGTESQTFTKRQRPGRSKKETVKVNVVN